jgi:hypothetical protein
MKPPTNLTPEQGERLRELYRKNYLAHILLPPEVVADEFPKQPPSAKQESPPSSDFHRTDPD